MKFEEVLPALREGKKIRRKTFLPGYYICLDGKFVKGFLPNFVHSKFTEEEIFSIQMEVSARLVRNGLLADDWEVVDDRED